MENPIQELAKDYRKRLEEADKKLAICVAIMRAFSTEKNGENGNEVSADERPMHS